MEVYARILFYPAPASAFKHIHFFVKLSLVAKFIFGKTTKSLVRLFVPQSVTEGPFAPEIY